MSGDAWFVYGSRARPLSFLWARECRPGYIMDTDYNTGFMSILLRKEPLPEETVKNLELTHITEVP